MVNFTAKSSATFHSFTNLFLLLSTTFVWAQQPISTTATSPRARASATSAITPYTPIPMVIMSDPQLWWYRQDCRGEPCADEATATNLNMLGGIQRIGNLGAWPNGQSQRSDITRFTATPPIVNINGDLTAYWHKDQVDTYKQIYESGNFSNTLYTGLGNHDYANNTPPSNNPNCSTTSCSGATYEVYAPDYWRNAKEAVWYMANKLYDGSMPNIVNRDVGGFVSLYNDAGFNTWLTVNYTLNGQYVTKESGSFSAGQRRGIPIPRAATGISMTIWKYNGINWLQVNTVQGLTVNRNCYRVQGTLSNASYTSTNCQHEWPTGSEGSLSYSYEIGKYHFVQLQLSPNYAVNMIERPLNLPIGAYEPYKSPGFNITKSFDWLTNDLTDATNRGKIIVIHVHSDDGYGGGSDFRKAIRNQNVIAVFSGHLHEQWGLEAINDHSNNDLYDNGRNNVRFFRSGAGEAERLLYAEFHDSYFKVGVVKTENGTPTFVTIAHDSIPGLGRNAKRYGTTWYDHNTAPNTYRWAKTSLITTQPADQSTCEGLIRLFHANVVTEATQFQWQIDAGTGQFTDISSTDARFSGVTSNTLEVINPTIGLSGYRFRVRVQDNAGNITTSDAATLTVTAGTRPTRVYVNVNATGSNNGSSWANAYTSLQSALNTNCPAPEVWVAKGVYKPTTSTTDRNARFAITSDIAIYGGFTGTETALSQRNVVANPTILSGDIDNDDVNTDANNIAETYTDVQGNNSIHVVSVVDMMTARLDGFIITGGLATIDSFDGEGAGLHNRGKTTVANCRFMGNQSDWGGAVNVDAGTLNVVNTTFSGNNADWGGAVLTYTGSTTFVNSSILNNRANTGGGLAINPGASCTLVNTVVWGNTSPTDPAKAGIFGSYAATYSDLQSLTTGTGNIQQDPLIPNAATGDLRPLSCSPLVNAGQPNSNTNVVGQTDLAGNPRIYNPVFDRIDIGAYELQGALTTATTIVRQPASNSVACAGGTAITSVSATGATGYQWYLNGAAVGGATSATLSVPNVQTANGGQYVAMVTGSCNSVNSTTFTLSLGNPVGKVYVKANATGTNNGTSWANAYTNLQSALQPGCPIPDVWVARGVYKPTATTARTVSFEVPPGTTIYGGFAGTETLLAQRNLLLNPTILSGDIDNNDANTDGNDIAESTTAVQGNNSYNVVKLNATATYSPIPGQLDGLIITAGKSNGRGGGVLSTPDNATLVNCRFTGNEASSDGGGFSCRIGVGSGIPTFINCSFTGNKAQFGGALAAIAPKLINCTVFGNQATNRGGGIDGTVNTVLNTIIWSNTAPNSSGMSGSIPSSTIEYSNIQSFTASGTNLSVDPQLTTADNSFTLTACSPMINAGAPGTTADTVGTTDLLNRTRIVQGRIDIGAFEYQGVQLAILQQPASNSVVCPGGSVTTNISTTGTVTGYQWYRDGVAVAGATSATLSIPNVQTASAGEYVIVVSNACTSLTSTVFSLSINVPVGRVYVNAAATGTNDGTSWPNAFTSLQSALQPGCPLPDVWVAKGVYKPTSTSNRAISFTIPSGVVVYGGFAGNETSLDGRNLSLNPTILSGDIDNNDTNTDGNSIAESITAVQGNNSYHVVTVPITSVARLDGFIVTGGVAINSGADEQGAGLFSRGQTIVANCRFQGNRGLKGAGIGVFGGTLTSINTAFSGNQGDNGGALLTSIGSSTLINCTVMNNHALNGVGIGVDPGANATLLNTIVWGNTASTSASGVYGSVNITYSNVQSVTTGTGNIQQNPMVENAAQGNLRLSLGSPMVNIGDPATTTSQAGLSDLAGAPRFSRTRIDIGAYEFQVLGGPIVTTKTGNWNDTSVWSIGFVPQAGDMIEIQHSVTLPASYVAYCLRASLTPTGRIRYGSGARLSFQP